jgi:hypothetical protein
MLSRATDAVANRLDRRSFLARSALVGSALVTAPGDLLLRPKTAYAAICSCQGQSCSCGSLCCDGYTEFCCALTGVNGCPTGSLTGGWWKADGSSFCGGRARYYMDCHKPCGSCTCGGSGVCSGACNGTPCGCGRGRCDHRKAGCTSFRYGNCSNHVACIGPIQCRVVTCTEPWKIEPTCSSSAVRTDNNTRTHNRPCLQQAPPIHPVAGDFDGNGVSGIGFYDNRSGSWSLRQTPTGGALGAIRYGVETGDRPVVGDWNGDGVAGVGIFRRGGEWHLSDVTPAVTNRRFTYGVQAGDIPVVGNWDGVGGDGIGIFRRGEWHLSNSVDQVRTDHVIRFGIEPGDVPVVGDWTGAGRDSIGVYRPTNGRWYLRRTLYDTSPITVVFGQTWVLS